MHADRLLLNFDIQETKTFKRFIEAKNRERKNEGVLAL
jgi:hypothetical protein